MVEAHRRHYFVGGNWKCNGTVAFLKDMIENTLNKVDFDPTKVCKSSLVSNLCSEVAIAPAAVHIPTALSLVNEHLIVAAQNSGA